MVVERAKLLPVGIAEVACIRVHRADRRCELVATRRLAARDQLAHDAVPLEDQRTVPAAAILLGERDQLAVGGDRVARRASVRSIRASRPAASWDSGSSSAQETGQADRLGSSSRAEGPDRRPEDNPR